MTPAPASPPRHHRCCGDARHVLAAICEELGDIDMLEQPFLYGLVYGARELLAEECPDCLIEDAREFPRSLHRPVERRGNFTAAEASRR